MSSTKTAIAVGLGVVAAGTVYVLVHEKRRAIKKLAKQLQDEPISKDTLLKILNKSAEHSKAILERIIAEVEKVKQARKMSDEQAKVLFQQNFEHSLDQLIGAIRAQFKVSEKAMDSSFKIHQNDPDVQAAIQNMRMLSAEYLPQPAQRAGASSSVKEMVPASLTREKLKEIMTFNAALLEKEFKPIKEEMARQRRVGKQPQVDPQALMMLQGRISEQVQRKYGVSDEQVMAAVESFGAREDPAFKEILQRIATTLNSSLQ